jgi:hypothetical protein
LTDLRPRRVRPHHRIQDREQLARIRAMSATFFGLPVWTMRREKARTTGLRRVGTARPGARSPHG